MTRQKLFRALALHGFLIVGSVFMVFPFFWMVSTSFKSPEEVLDARSWLPEEKLYFRDDPGRRADLLTQVRRVEPPHGEAASAPPSSGHVFVEFLSGPRRGTREWVPSNRVESRVWLWENYVKAWNQVQPDFGRYFWVSLVSALLTTTGQVVTSLLAAYAFSYFNFPLKGMTFNTFLATMMVPQQVLLIPNFLLLKYLGWYDSYAALVVPWLASVFGIFLLQQFMLSLPRDLYDAAIVDGCSRFGYLWRVIVPLSVAPILTLAVFTFLATWNALLWPLIVTDSPEMRTIQVGLSFFTQESGTRWELMMAAATFSTLPLIVFYFFAQKYFIAGIARSGLKG